MRNFGAYIKKTYLRRDKVRRYAFCVYTCPPPLPLLLAAAASGTHRANSILSALLPEWPHAQIKLHLFHDCKTTRKTSTVLAVWQRQTRNGHIEPTPPVLLPLGNVYTVPTPTGVSCAYNEQGETTRLSFSGGAPRGSTTTTTTTTTRTLDENHPRCGGTGGLREEEEEE